MRGRSWAGLGTLLAALLAAGGCTTTARPISPGNYAAYVEVLKGSPAIRRDEIRGCSAQLRTSPQQTERIRKLANLAPGQDPRPVVCRRIVDAVASGRLTYAEMQAAVAGQTGREGVRIIQGR